MKLKLILFFLLLLFVFSCKKDANNSPIVGKWRTTEIYYTLNTPGSSPLLYIQFNSSGTVQSTFFSDCTGYSISGNNLTLKYTGAPITQASYTYSIKQDTLTLNASNCSDGGCNLTFVRE